MYARLTGAGCAVTGEVLPRISAQPVRLPFDVSSVGRQTFVGVRDRSVLHDERLPHAKMCVAHDRTCRIATGRNEAEHNVQSRLQPHALLY